MKLFLLILFLQSGVLCVPSIYGQGTADIGREKRRIASADKHPNQSIDMHKVSRVKIFLANEIYRLGDLARLEVGLLVSDKEELFFSKNLKYRVYIHDKSGKRILFKNIFAFDYAADYKKYRNDIIKDSTDFSVGCDTKFLRQYGEAFRSADLDSPKSVFDSNLFSTIITNCIDIHDSADLEMYIEVYNDMVVAPAGKEKAKTATGKIKSNTIPIRVIKDHNPENSGI